MKLFVLAIATATLATLSSAQTYPLPVRSSRAAAPVPAAPAAPGGSAPLTTQTFQVVDLISHHDDFWSNLLVGDADHDGLQEIVEHVVPLSSVPGPNTIAFFEDDGTGDFTRVAGIPFVDGGLLAMGDIDGDGLTDLFAERAITYCQHEFVRFEASSPGGFPDHLVWSAVKQGNMVDFNGTIADVDGDGVLEFITTDNNFSCLPTSLKVFEPAPGDQMTLTANLQIGAWLGNPVAADFDQDGAREILVVDEGNAVLYRIEAQGNDQYALVQTIPSPYYNGYQLALVDRWTPDGRPIVFQAGQMGSQDYRVQAYECVPPGGPLAAVQETQIPAGCGASIPQISAADLFGSRRAELVLSRLCDDVPILSIDTGGALTLFQDAQVTASIGVIAAPRTPLHPGSIAVPTSVTTSWLDGLTRVLRLQ